MRFLSQVGDAGGPGARTAQGGVAVREWQEARRLEPKIRQAAGLMGWEHWCVGSLLHLAVMAILAFLR